MFQKMIYDDVSAEVRRKISSNCDSIAEYCHHLPMLGKKLGMIATKSLHKIEYES